MNRDDIIRMAENSGCGWIQNGTEPALFGEKHITQFANLVASHERQEAAAKRNDLTARIEAYLDKHLPKE